MVAQIRQFDLADILTIHPDRTACHIIKSRNQTAQRTFSCTGASNQRHILSRRDFQIYMVQHHLITVCIMKGHIFKTDLTFHFLHRLRIRRIFDIRYHRDHLHKTLKSGITILELFRKINQRFYRLSEYINIQQKCDQIRDISFSTGNHHTARQHDNNGNCCCKRSQAGIVTAHIPITVFLCIQKSVIALFELFIFNFLIGKGFYHTDSRQIILNLTVNICNFHTVHTESALHFFVEHISVHQHKRHQCKCCHCQPWTDIYHNNESTDNANQRNHDIFRSVMQ